MMTPIRLLPAAIVAGFMLICIPTAKAQPKPIFEQLVPNEDLTASEVTALLQDPAGFIWIGTRNGLNRFDGKEVKQFVHNPNDSTSISHNDVQRNALYMHAGYLWIGTANGLSRFDPSSGTFKQYYFPAQDSLQVAPVAINSILAASTTSLWLGSNEGLYWLDLESDDFNVYNIVPLDSTSNSIRTNSIAALSIGPSGKLWLGTEKGIFSFSPQRNLFSPLELDHPDLNSTFGEYTYTLAWRESTLSFGTANGLAQKDMASGEEKLYMPDSANSPSSNNLVNGILHDDSGNMWFSTHSKGLCKLDEIDESFTCFMHSNDDPFSIADNTVITILQDYEGQIWAGTWNGVSRMIRNIDFSTLTHDPEQNTYSLSNSRVHTIHELPDRTLLIGTEGGLNVVNPYTRKIDLYRTETTDSLTSNSLWGISSADEKVWIASERGLNLWDLQTRKFKNYLPSEENENGLLSQYMYKVLIDDQETLWISSHYGGLSKLIDPAKGIFKTYVPTQHPASISFNVTWPLFQHKPGELLVGTLGGGLNKLEIEKEKFTVYRPGPDVPHSISGEYVLTIAGDSLGQIWLGMQNTGLNRFDPEKEAFYNFTEEDGLADNEISCILPEKDERLWIATRNGLSIFDLKTETFVLNLYKQNGLPTSMFLAGACEIGASGIFRFGTEEGMVSFYPDSLDLNIPRPKVAISALEVNNKARAIAPLQTRDELSYDENTIGFRLAALSFIAPEKNTFSYRLTGLDTTWIDLGTNNFIYLTNLPANDYTLEVRARNSAGLSNAVPLTYNFTINPPYWKTVWFQLLMMALIGFLGFIIYQSRVRYLIGLKTKDLEKQIELDRMKDENDKKIVKITKDISNDFHDGIGSGLGSLGLEVDLLKGQANLSEEIIKKLDHLRRRINRLMNMRKDLGWIIDASHDEFEQMLEHLRSIAYEIVHDPVQLHIDIEEGLPAYKLDMPIRKNLLLLVREALYNAVKHAKAKNITLSVSSVKNAGSNTCCVIQIIDDGIGFEPETVKKGEGLNSMRSRSDDMDGKMTIEKAIPHGTMLSIAFDLKMDDSSYSNDGEIDLD